MPSPTIELQKVDIDRPAIINGRTQSVRVLSNVNLHIAPAERLAIFGPSGAGKSSLLRVLNRLDEPSSGSIHIDGTDIRQLDPTALRRRVAMVFQQPFLFNETVLQNIAYPRRLQQLPLTRDEAAALLAEVGLSPDLLERQAQQLSGGQQQRVALARTLSLQPDILLLDEPTSALDAESAHLLMDALLRRNAEQGVTLIMVTHAREMMHRLHGKAVLVHMQHAFLYPDVETALREADQAQVRME